MSSSARGAFSDKSRSVVRIGELVLKAGGVEIGTVKLLRDDVLILAFGLNYAAPAMPVTSAQT
jgi:hypothetical protein